MRCGVGVGWWPRRCVAQRGAVWAENMQGIYISLGSNLGDRRRYLDTALAQLDCDPDIGVVAVSTYHETVPAGGPPHQGLYLNAVAELDTALPPQSLLDRLLAIEQRNGRQRHVRFGPRTLDLDLLLYRAEIISEPTLTVPHPRMWEREFVMKPLAEICDVDRLREFRARLARAQPQADAAGSPEVETPCVR